MNDTTAIPLRADFGPGALTDDVFITASDANDIVSFHRSSLMAAPTNADCGFSNWAPIQFNGFTVEVDLRAAPVGINIFNGPPGSPDFVVRGGANRDWFYGFSSTGEYTGNEGADEFLLSVAATSGRLRAGDGVDCIELAGGTFGGTLDCGAGTDIHNRVASGRPASCEASGFTTTPGCGLI